MPWQQWSTRSLDRLLRPISSRPLPWSCNSCCSFDAARSRLAREPAHSRGSGAPWAVKYCHCIELVCKGATSLSSTYLQLIRLRFYWQSLLQLQHDLPSKLLIVTDLSLYSLPWKMFPSSWLVQNLIIRTCMALWFFALAWAVLSFLRFWEEKCFCFEFFSARCHATNRFDMNARIVLCSTWPDGLASPTN